MENRSRTRQEIAREKIGAGAPIERRIKRYERLGNAGSYTLLGSMMAFAGEAWTNADLKVVFPTLAVGTVGGVASIFSLRAQSRNTDHLMSLSDQISKIPED